MAVISISKRAQQLCCLLPLALIIGSCVSSALEPGQFRPVGAANKAVPQSPAMTSEPVAINPVKPTEETQQSGKSANPDTDPNAVDEAARQRAIAEMRAKGRQTSGQKTTIGALPEPATSQLTDVEREQKARELSEKVDAVNETISEGEVETKQQSIRRLQQKAKSHYENAIENIEN